MLTQSREKRVEELEQRLKWMEGHLKRAIGGRQCEADGEYRNGLIGLETPSFNQFQAGPSYLTQNIQGDGPLDPTFTIAEASSQVPGFEVPSQNSNFKSSM